MVCQSWPGQRARLVAVHVFGAQGRAPESGIMPERPRLGRLSLQRHGSRGSAPAVDCERGRASIIALICAERTRQAGRFQSSSAPRVRVSPQGEQ
jgi:hypothetical protein